ncbi:MAG TPA: acyloxyacyl hydrolase [Bordetella sp.]
MAQADGEGTQGGIGIHYGFGDRFSRFNLQYETPSVWTYSFGGNWGRVDLTPEIGVAYWHAHSGNSPSSVWQLNAIPMFRWWTSEHFYIEAGAGPTLFSRVAFAGRYYSSAFQFGDHIGVGYLIDKHNRIGVRISHFSNASIKEPNPGMTMAQVTYTYQF